MSEREIALRDKWRAQNGITEVPARGRQRGDVATVPVTCAAPPRPAIHFTPCPCAQCKGYWASRYDAIAPITDAFIENRQPPFCLSASHGLLPYPYRIGEPA